MLTVNLPPRRPAGLAVALFAASCLTLGAFPPAPFYTLHGMVRDENGQTLRVDGARVAFYRNTTELFSETIKESTQLDQNYQLRMRMDMLRAGTQSYSELANTTGTAFSLRVVMHDVPYLPIEMSSPRLIGKPGERTRLDLTLGVDSDGDGIPDAWEQSQLYAGGIAPGENGWDLSLLDRDGDFDRDGVSNWDEYIAGTFATDPTHFLAVRFSARFPDSVRLTFSSIYGRRYSLETTTDLVTWSPAPLYLSNPADPFGGAPNTGEPRPLELPADKYRPDSPPAAQPSLLATGTGLVNIYATAASGPVFYRLKVR